MWGGLALAGLGQIIQYWVVAPFDAWFWISVAGLAVSVSGTVIKARRRAMTGFLRGIETDVPREPDRDL